MAIAATAKASWCNEICLFVSNKLGELLMEGCSIEGLVHESLGRTSGYEVLLTQHCLLAGAAPMVSAS